MRHGEMMLICAMTSLLLGMAANAATAPSATSNGAAAQAPSSRPASAKFAPAKIADPVEATGSRGEFQGIVERNVFGLRAPPPPPPPPEPPKPPVPNLTLTGIIKGLGKKRALMEAVLPVKPPETPKKTFFTLGEGEGEGEIEVIKIDEVAGSVQVKDYGVITNLTFAANGVKQPSGILPAGVAPGGGMIPPPVNPYAPGGGRTLPTMPGAGGMPTRPVRSGLPGQADAGAVNPAAGTAAYGGGAYQPGFASAQGAQVAAPMSLEEQTILIEAERERNKEAIANGRAPPLPNTLVTREADAAANAAAANAGNAGAYNNTTSRPGLRRAPTLPPLLPQ